MACNTPSGCAVRMERAIEAMEGVRVAGPRGKHPNRRRRGDGLLAALVSTPSQRQALKVQLVHPPGVYNPKNLSSLTPSLPLGLAYVAAALEQAGFTVGIVDAIGEAPTRVERYGGLPRVGLGTAELVRRIDPDDVNMSFFFPIPNTELYHRLVKAGRIQLTDEFFMTPIASVDLRLRRANNYCEHLSAFRLTAFKYWLFVNFYVTSFVLRPSRLVRLLGTLVTQREDSKLEAFIQELKRRARVSLGLRRAISP